MSDMIRWFVFLSYMLSATGVHARPISAQEYEHQLADYNMLSTVKDHIDGIIGGSENLFSYRDAYNAHMNQLAAQPSSKDMLAEKIRKSSLIIFGDDHANPQSQKNFIWTMEELSKAPGDNKIVVLEWIKKEYQNHVNDYLAGKLGQTELREKIKFDETWGFRWPDHLAILRAAKKLGFQVLAPEGQVASMEISQRLRARDNKVVSAIQRLRKQQPYAQILVMYGEYHIAGGSQDPHLKEKLEIKNIRPDLTIYPFPVQGYWELLKASLDTDSVESLKISETEYFLNQGSINKMLNALKFYAKAYELSEEIDEIFENLKSIEALEALGKFTTCDQAFK